MPALTIQLTQDLHDQFQAQANSASLPVEVYVASLLPQLLRSAPKPPVLRDTLSAEEVLHFLQARVAELPSNYEFTLRTLFPPKGKRPDVGMMKSIGRRLHTDPNFLGRPLQSLGKTKSGRNANVYRTLPE